ncbi:class I adenylate-forming enzyme family protein [Pseudomaricurvus sp. HS19]|uniref:class I adenylate-forming enzyme family protein n=1 Tax=Pseudomaricurvus sp. HS19 TaxID=2692626 RepID=UPI00136EBAE6|nr:class I adenylate-forming enzyme family protein [Pseudomaricurvus sp. HS19]MYM61926.1 AMP-binding protein [Pseudomaricurvus sp. HS19]
MSALSECIGIALEDEPGLGALTLSGFITEVCQKYPDREALYWRNLEGEDQRWSYAELYAECEKVARSLLSMGIGKGSRVGVLITNRPEWIFATFGAALAGAVTVALNTFSTRSELQHQLMLADVEVLVLEQSVASHSFVEDMLELCPGLAAAPMGLYRHPQLPFLRRVVCVDEAGVQPGIQSWGDFLAEGADIPAELVTATAASCSATDDGLIFFSSGSTAQPKAIQQSHRAATLQCWRAGRWYLLEENVRTWSANGFFWSGNFAMALGSTLSVGGCLVLQRFFQPDESLDLIQREKVSMAFAWPHQYARLKECPGWANADLSALIYVDKNGILGSHPSVNTEWLEPNGYGMTETFTFIAGGNSSEITDGSHGPVLAGNTVRIVDPDSGEILPLGETGEIIIKGPTLTRGYLKTPPEQTFDGNGFIHTADAGYLSAEGTLFWKGRLGDIIKTGGANVSPTEIDAVLMQHPDLQSSFTVGIPDELLGEIVVSCVILRQGRSADEESVRRFGRETLAAYKVPRRVLFFTEEELPMTGSNKIRRSELKALVIGRLSDA